MDKQANESDKESVSLSSFIGQRRIRQRIKEIVAAAHRTHGILFHLLLSGPADSGKTTLSRAIATDMGVNIKLVNATSLEVSRDLAALLTNLDEGDFFLIEEIDLFKRSLEEILISAVKDFQIEIMIGQGIAARPIRLDLKPFTFVGTTTRAWQVAKRLRRLMLPFELDPYDVQEIAQIVQILGKGESLDIKPDAALLLAEYCEGSPGVAKSLIKRLRLFGTGAISTDLAKQRLDSLGMLHKERATSPDLADKLQAMDGQEFEGFVAELFQRMGYEVEVVGQTGDHGIDLLGKKDGDRIGVQCKRWSGTVGESIVRDFYGSIIHAGAVSGHIITTGSFSTSAFKFAEGKAINLVDLDALMDLVSQNP